MYKQLICSVVLGMGFSLSACNTNAENALPVIWTEAFTLPPMMEADVKVKTQADVSKLLSAKWYSAFEVKKPLSNNKDDIRSIGTCESYFSNPGMETVVSRDYGPYLGIGLMCKAAKIIASAGVSSKSYLANLKFDKELPGILPKSFAMVVSTSESKRIDENKSLVTWGDVEKITKTEIKSTNATEYYVQGGQYTVELVAKGDFNNDKIEDWLISSTYSVTGGTYVSFRMFAVTMTKANSGITIIEEISDKTD